MLESEREVMEQEIREKFENAYKERLNTMKNIYQTQKQTLQKTLADSYTKVLEDPMLRALLNDRISSDYTEDRIKELFQEIVANQREFVIEKLGLKCSQLSFKYQELEIKYKTLVQKVKNDEEMVKSRFHNSQTMSIQHTQCLRKKQQQIYELKLQMQASSTEQRLLENRKEELLKKLSELQHEKEYFQNQYEKIKEDLTSTLEKQQTKFQLKDVDLEDSNRKISLLQNHLRQIEKAHEDKMSILEQKYRKKIQEYKNKIEEYKKKIMQLINQKKESQGQKNYYQQVNDLERKLLSLNKEHERKIYEIQEYKDKEKIALEKKYESKYRELQNYYEKLLEDKITEVERNAEEAVEKIKMEEDQIKKYVEFMEENSTPNQEYTKLNKYYQGIIGRSNQQQKQYEQYIEQLHAENDKLQNVYENIQKQLESLKSSKKELEITHNELVNKLKLTEQQFTAFRNVEAKLKGILSEKQQEMLTREQELFTQKDAISNFQTSIAVLQKTIQDKQCLLASCEEKLESVTKRAVKQSKEIATLIEQNEDLLAKNSGFKKQISEKEHKLATIKQEYEFKIEEINFTAERKQKISKQLLGKVKNTEEKLQGTELQLRELMKEKSTLEATLKKIEMENKYLKQNEENMKIQYEGFISQYKKKIADRDSKIEELETNLSYSTKNSTSKSTALEQRNLKLEKTIRKLSKFLYQECDLLNRSLKDIKISLQGMKNLLNDQLNLLWNSFSFKIQQFSNNIINSNREKQRVLKQSHQKQISQLNQHSRSKIQNLEETFTQRIEAEKKNNEALLLTKDKQIERVEKQKRKYGSEKEELLQTIRSYEKKVNDGILLVENEKISGKNKVSELIRDFDEEKERIIRDYDDRRAKKEEQLQGIMKVLSKLKTQYSLLKQRQENERKESQKQIKASSERIKELEMDMNKKELKLEHLSQRLLKLEDSNKEMSIELKKQKERCFENGNQKIQLQMKNNQILAQIQIIKNKYERVSEENQQLNRQLSTREQQLNYIRNNKSKIEMEYSQLKSALNKTVKNPNIKAIQQFDQETKSLSSKVDALKKVSCMIDFKTEKTPLRY